MICEVGYINSFLLGYRQNGMQMIKVNIVHKFLLCIFHLQSLRIFNAIYTFRLLTCHRQCL